MHGVLCGSVFAEAHLDDLGVKVLVKADKFGATGAAGNFIIHLTCPMALSPEQAEGLRRSAHHCLIHNTLLSVPKVEIEVTDEPDVI